MTLDIIQIEKQRQNFYAPAFNILIGNASVVRDLKLEVTSVQVEMGVEGRADRFTFSINNAWDISKREFVKVDGKTIPELFSFGLALEIYMGYGDRRHLDFMIAGIVTELSTSFPSSGLPSLTISGYDHSYCLTRGATSRNWGEGKTDSQVVNEVARRFNLQARVEDTSVVHDRIDQTQESTAAFLSRLAKRSGFEWYVRRKELFFGKRANTKQGAIELVWGRGLVSFSPDINLSEQVSAVEVHGWNVQTKSPIVGRAKKGDESGLDPSRPSGKPRFSGAQALEKVCKEDQAVLQVRETVANQQEADRRALAILQERSEMYLTGRGESIGIPEIRPAANVTLKGLGDLFSKTLYVKQTTHTVDTSGYHTTFEVKESNV